MWEPLESVPVWLYERSPNNNVERTFSQRWANVFVNVICLLGLSVPLPAVFYILIIKLFI